MKSNKKPIAQRLLASKKIAICSHIRPDADSIGSGLALAAMLHQKGIQVSFCNTDPAPHPINLLPGYPSIQLRPIYPEPFDCVALIEGATEDRTGQKNLSQYFCINIDHHETSSTNADLNWIDPGSAAVGEMIFDLGVEMGIQFTADIAFNLYAAIASDTGSFKYSNTTHRSLQICADLVEKSNIAPFEVANLLFNSNPKEKIDMMTRVLSTLELILDNRVAMIRFERKFLENLTLKEIETEDIITIARSIDGVQVLLFFKEIDRDYYRVSIRSRDNFSAQEVARRFNGGGHHHAAGFFFRGSLEEAKKEITAAIQQQFHS